MLGTKAFPDHRITSEEDKDSNFLYTLIGQVFVLTFLQQPPKEYKQGIEG